MREADNVFNSAILWNSYRGPIQYDFRKRQYVYDFHRVALHEFGHTLGLDHPDDYGQTVTAIMFTQLPRVGSILLAFGLMAASVLAQNSSIRGSVKNMPLPKARPIQKTQSYETCHSVPLSLDCISD